MANITVTLLTSKRTRQTIDALDSVVAAQAGGYTVVEGEDNATEIVVNYPETYTSKNRYVYMKNARGEYDTKEFSTGGTQKTFTLPGSMAYRGNTILVFYATDGDSTTAWLPVIVPVAETGVDYKQVATASEDFLKEILKTTGEAVKICQEVQKQAEAGAFNGADGQSVFIRYSANPDGRAMTELWTTGQRYIGTYIGTNASTNYSDYTWLLFVGDAYCSEDAASGAVSVMLAHDTDKTLTAADITSLTITIPAGAKHGFYAGLNYRTGASAPVVRFINNSGLTLKLLLRGAVCETYTPGTNKTVQTLFYSDGLNVYGYINEV